MKLLYSVAREYQVDVERLWHCWTDAKELEAWYSPVFLSVVPGSASSEVKVGGSWAIAIDVSANGFNAYFWGKYQEVIPQQKFTHTLNYSQDELEFALRQEQSEAHLIQVEFEDHGKSSSVRFSQFGEMEAEQAEAAREGMESYLENLASYLTSAKSRNSGDSIDQ